MHYPARNDATRSGDMAARAAVRAAAPSRTSGLPAPHRPRAPPPRKRPDY